MEVPLPQTSIKDAKLVVIIILLAMTTNTKGNTRELQTEIYNRLREKFYDRLHKATNKLFSGFSEIDMIRDEVFNDAFLLLFEKFPEFKTNENWSDKECEKVLIYWLSDTANKLILKRYREHKIETMNLEAYKSYDEWEQIKGEPVRREYEPTYDVVKFKEVMESLNPLAKEVLLACIETNTIKENNTTHLPDEVIDALTKKYNVTSGAIRKAKERTLKKLINCKIVN